jgi:hypothetical protein
MSRYRRHLRTVLWAAAQLLAHYRRVLPDPRAVRQIDWPAHLRGAAVTPFLRDRLRRRWLRLRSADRPRATQHSEV